MVIRSEGPGLNQAPENRVTITSSSKGPVIYGIDMSGQRPTQYHIRTIISDPKGRINATEISFAPPFHHEPVLPYIASTPATPKLETVWEESIKISAKQQSYKIGETAELIVQCPFAPCEGMQPCTDPLFCIQYGFDRPRSAHHGAVQRNHEDACRPH